MRRPKYRLSPNEIERFVKEDQDRRRKLRIVQVREQSKANAAVIRNDVRREKERLLNNFAAEVKEQLDAEKDETARKLEQKYENTLRAIGEGHREAIIHDKGDGENRAEKLQKQMQEETAAQERYTKALERQRKEDSTKDYERTKHILARQTALEKEKQRAAEIASLPPPPPDISVEMEKIKKRAIPMTDMKAFATTHYHIPDYHVVKAEYEEQLYDAKVQAQDSDLKLKQDLEEKKRSQHERHERARIRGNEALQKELLKHEYDDMLKDLSLLQRRDRRMRKKMLSDIPNQVFVPPELCLEERAERQRQMENKFNEIFMQHSKVETNMLNNVNTSDHAVLQDTPDVGPTATHDVSLPMSRINPALRDLTNVTQPVENLETNKPETVLKQLMNRIKKQRDSSVISHKDPSGVSFKDKPTSLDNNQAVMFAGGRAGWEMSQEDLVLAGSNPKDRSRVHGLFDTDKNGQPDMALTKLTDSEKMIEDLKRRIELIECQKQDLAQQFMTQSSSHRRFLADLENDGSHKDDEDNCTLEEVDIQTFDELQLKTDIRNDKHVKVWPDGVADSKGDQVLPSSAWTGFRETHPEIRREVDLEVQRDKHLYRGIDIIDRIRFDGGDFEHASGQQQVIDNSQHLYQPFTSLDRLNSLGYGTLSPGLSKYVGQGHMMHLRHGQGDYKKVEPSMGLQNKDVDLMKKVKEYTKSAWERQAGMDAETVQRVREYQQKLLQTHEQRKKYLAGIRTDIENRRHELHASATYLPTLNMENDQVKQSVIENLKKSNGNVQTSTSVDHKMMIAKPDRACDVGISHGWMPAQSTITNSRSLSTHFQVPLQITEYEPHKESEEKMLRVTSENNFARIERNIDKNSGDKQTAIIKEKDKVRKSLSFEDAELSFSNSHVAWKDVLNDTDNTLCSQNLSEDSKLTSSEEERGSPTLPHARLEISDKSTSSATGNMPLNGSALLAQAQEKNLGFVHRQKELQNQLLDIQRQKEAIMQTYFAGQKALQQRQTTLMSKLATASVLSSEDNGGKQRAELRAKLADVRSQIDADARNVAISQDIGIRNIPSSLDHGQETKPSSVVDGARLAAVYSNTRESVNETRDTDGTTSRQSLGSGGTPGNISLDSYLAEISFHKFRSDDDNSLPSSAFQALVPGSSVPRNLSINQQPHSQTWASILSLSTSVRQEEESLGSLQQDIQEASMIGQQNQKYVDQFSFTNYQEQHEVPFNKEGSILDSDRSQMADTSVNMLDDHQQPYCTLPPLSTPLGLADHQPHELSTIMEVETPSSYSALNSVKKPITSAASTTSSSHTISSLSSHSIISDLPPKSSDIRVDVFMDLPYTFREGRAASLGPSGAIYSLSSGYNTTDLMSKAKIGLVPTTVDHRQIKAKRTLDFSDNLFATSMPMLVELTPLKKVEIQDLDGDGLQERGLENESMFSHHHNISDDSSFKISGYSDFLRIESLEGRDSKDTINMSDTTVNKCDSFIGGVGGSSLAESGRECNNRDSITRDAVYSSVLQQAEGFDKGVVERLRQQSQVVFSGVSTGGSSGHEISELSQLVSSVTSDLEEVSITDTV